MGLNLAGIFSRWFPIFSATTGQNIGHQLTGPVASAIPSNRVVNPDTAMQIAAVWACVTLNANTIAQMPCFLYGRDASGNKRLMRNDPLYTVLHDQPNQYQTPFVFWQTMGMQRQLKGNAYARIRRNAVGNVVSMTPLSSDHTRPVVLDDGSVVYESWSDDKINILSADSVFHWRGLGNGVVGLSRIEFARASMGLALDAQDHANKTYRKGARRGFMLHFDRVLTDDQREAVKRRQAEYDADPDRSLYFFEAIPKVEPLSLSPADLKTLEFIQQGTKEICMWFGVPGPMINDLGQATAWGTGISEIVEGYYKTTVGPELTGLQQEIARQILTFDEKSRGYHVEFEPNALLRMTAKDRAELHAKNVQNGLKTRNEIRQLENDPPLPGADVLTAQSNLLPLDMLGKVQGGASGIQEPVAQ